MDIAGDRLGDFLARYVQVEDVLATMSKAGIVTGDFVLEVTLICKDFTEIPKDLMCQERMIFMVVVGSRPTCWSRGASGRMSKECPDKNMASQPCQAAAEEFGKTPTVFGRRWLGGTGRRQATSHTIGDHTTTTTSP